MFQRGDGKGGERMGRVGLVVGAFCCVLAWLGRNVAKMGEMSLFQTPTAQPCQITPETTEHTICAHQRRLVHMPVNGSGIYGGRDNRLEAVLRASPPFRSFHLCKPAVTTFTAL